MATATETPLWSVRTFMAEHPELGRDIVYRGIRLGHIPSVRIGGRYFIPKAAWHSKLRDAGETCTVQSA